MKQLSTERKAPICYMTDKEKVEKALSLVNELLAMAESKDEKHKQEALDRGQSEEAIGESYDVFYLRLLKGLLDGEEL